MKNRYYLEHPSFTLQKWGKRWYSLHGHVCIMSCLPPGFTGPQCEIDTVNGCDDSFCDASAMCQDTTDGFRCLCPVDSIVQDEL